MFAAYHLLDSSHDVFESLGLALDVRFQQLILGFEFHQRQPSVQYGTFIAIGLKLS